MRLLIVLALCLIPLSAFAQSVPPPMPSITNDSVTVIHPTPYSDVLYDQYGNSAAIYQQGPGLSWYSQQDKNGNIVSQGYLFAPLPRPEPLTMPSNLPSREYPSDNTGVRTH